MDKENWNNTKNYILSVLENVKSELDQESIESVKHYLEHEEYEMAFEGLFIEIMNLKNRPSIDCVRAKKFGELLELNKESVFDFDFWKKFESFCSTN